jgi:hypothetical protein
MYKTREEAFKHLESGESFKSKAFDNMRGDKEIVMEVIKRKNGWNLEHASPELQADRAFILEAVKQDGKSLLFASEELQADKEVVIEAVKQDGFALMYASDDLRGDKEIVLEAVKQDGRLLKYASDDIQILCEGKDPVLALQEFIITGRMQKMQQQLKPKAPSHTRAMKI